MSEEVIVHKSRPGFGCDAAGWSQESGNRGFALVELLLSMLILVIALLAAGQHVFVVMSSASLSRSKGVAVLIAQNKLEALSGMSGSISANADLIAGNHGPESAQILDQADGRLLNRFNVTWSVSPVPDSRPGKAVEARMVTVTVTPVDSIGRDNRKSALNKVICITSILSARARS